MALNLGIHVLEKATAVTTSASWGKRKKKFLKPLDFSCNVNYNFRVTESEVIV